MISNPREGFTGESPPYGSPRQEKGRASLPKEVSGGVHKETPPPTQDGERNRLKHGTAARDPFKKMKGP